MENTENEEIVEQQPPDYNKEMIITLLTIVMIILFFIAKNTEAKTFGDNIVLGLTRGLRFIFSILLSIFTIASWITDSKNVKEVLMIISLCIVGVALPPLGLIFFIIFLFYSYFFK